MDQHYVASLNRLFELPCAEYLERQRLHYSKATKSLGEKLVLCGCGYLGKKVLSDLRSGGIEPLAFLDNNPTLWNTRVHGIDVLSPQEAVARFGSAALFVVTVYTSGSLLKQVQSLGVTVVSFPEFSWAHPEPLLPHAALDLPHKIFDMEEAVREGLEVWQDKGSLEEYVGQLQWRTSLDPAVLPPSIPPDRIYFPEELLTYRTDEVFVDCGAFDGDSIRAFIDRRGTSFKEAIGVEADPGNYARLERCFAATPAPIRAKLAALNLAVGSELKLIRFNATGTAGSSVGEGDVEVNCAPLDVALEGRVPTYIKMDIEGAEREAILGARRIIGEYAPVLAICLYHRQEDLWQIPLLLRSMQPSYRLFLRRYSDECWEQVCYAVPRDRLK